MTLPPFRNGPPKTHVELQLPRYCSKLPPTPESTPRPEHLQRTTSCSVFKKRLKVLISGIQKEEGMMTTPQDRRGGRGLLSLQVSL